MKIFHFFQQIQNSLTSPFIPCLTLCFKKLPIFNQNIICSKILQIEPIHSEIIVQIDENSSINYLGIIQFENHEIKLLSNDSQLPEHLIETCIQTSHWQPEFKNKVLSTNATITLVYSGKSIDPVENYLALYKVASVFYDDNLLGIINEPAWCYHPAGLLPKIIFNNMINLCRNSPPFLFWTGFIKTPLDLQTPFHKHQTTCFFTKGHHVFGIPDLVYYSEKADPMRIKKLFNDIIEYAWFEKKELQPGDYIGFIDHEVYELIEPEENLEFLESPTKTLFLKPHKDNYN
jgi:hypothetical protein